MKKVLTVTKKHYSLRLLTFTLPVLMVGMLQMGGCMRGAAQPPPPGGTYLSFDGGVTFEQHVMREETEREGQHIARFSLGRAHRPFHDPTAIYIPARERGIIFSKNNGKTWEVIEVPLASAINIVVLPNDTWVVSGTGVDGQGYVVRSVNQGEEWEIALTVPLETQGRQFSLFRNTASSDVSIVVSIAQDPFNPDRVYAGSNLGTIFAGGNSGQSWHNMHFIGDHSLMGLQAQQAMAIQEIIVSPNEPNDYLILTRTRSLIRVTGGEQQTLKIPRNLGQEPSIFGDSQSLRVFDAKFIPGFPDAILVGVSNGVALSVDRGANWRKLTVPIDEVLDFSRITVTISPSNPNRFFASFNNVLYRSEDAGQTWITYSFGAIGVPGAIADVSIDPTNENNILVVTSPLNI